MNLILNDSWFNLKKGRSNQMQMLLVSQNRYANYSNSEQYHIGLQVYRLKQPVVDQSFPLLIPPYLHSNHHQNVLINNLYICALFYNTLHQFITARTISLHIFRPYGLIIFVWKKYKRANSTSIDNQINDSFDSLWK